MGRRLIALEVNAVTLKRNILNSRGTVVLCCAERRSLEILVVIPSVLGKNLVLGGIHLT